MKKLTIILSAICILGGFCSCSDMLDTESTRMNINPDIDQKTDSVFYAFGILQAMQELADQYVLTGEMRGELLKTTEYTDNNLRQLADFSATTANAYDSAYVYYKVINNCNYFIAHRDTTLLRGSTNVTIDEYAAVKAIRAWAYLQLGRNYERVPFFLEPLTEISKIDNNSFPPLTLEEMEPLLTEDLERYTGFKVPTYGLSAAIVIGTPNWNSTDKTMLPSSCFIPVDVVLGDLYLEVGKYEQAAKHFITYLTKVARTTMTRYVAPMASKYVSRGRLGSTSEDNFPEPSQISVRSVPGATEWATIFGENSLNDIVTYIPMAVNRQAGKTTSLPLIFGFNYYATSDERANNGESQPYVDEIQLVPSDELNLLSDSTYYYYYAKGRPDQDEYDSINIAKCGDMRLRSILHTPRTVTDDNVDVRWIDKYKYANIVLYRNSTIYLRLAEALNRLEMPDAAFAILKDGISEYLLRQNSEGDYYASYLTDDTRSLLQTTYPLLSAESLELFPAALSCGIHCHGAGKAVSDCATVTYKPGSSPYTFENVVGKKLDEIATVYGVTVGTTKQDTINAMEDLICDEYALELAFEGTRYPDLMRLAKHKNDKSPAGYPAQFGYEWLRNKLGSRGWSEAVKYLPFK